MSFLGQKMSFEVFFGQHLTFYVILHVSEHYRETLLNHPVLGELLRHFNYVFNHVDLIMLAFSKLLRHFHVFLICGYREQSKNCIFSF